MSLNGDVTVIRNGRCTSTVSIYNYPEHLNPFYEDDQHKRLRFWPINQKGSEGRRNSFSLGGLKDMWAFKSFRTKKKSSTLGINKTSESPPTLRRVYPVDSSNLFNSNDRRARYSSDDNDNFQRNASYRSSLQNVQSTQDSPSGFGLNRNDQYRSTIQFGNRKQPAGQTLPVPRPRRYVYGGSVTPQPSRSSNYGRGYSRETLTHGSSQTSISTNPFESDNDEESEHIEREGGAPPMGGKRTPRKKRRAPPPPPPPASASALIPTHSKNGTATGMGRLSTESSQENPRHSTELRIEEDLDIANLTAEIESFVKTKSNETPEREIKPTATKEIPPINELPKTNGTIPKTKPILKSSPNMVITKEFRPKLKNTELQISEDLKIEEKPALPAKKRIQHTLATQEITQKQQQQQPQQPTIGNVECIHVHVESPRSTPERDATNRVTSFKKEPIVSEKITAKTSFTLASPPSNRREVPDINTGSIQKTQVTETVVAVKKEEEMKNSAKPNHVANGVVRKEIVEVKEHTVDPPAIAKPPIAAKPNIETKAKVNNFAVIHKPGRRTVLSSESDEIALPDSKTIQNEEITIKEIHTSKGPDQPSEWKSELKSQTSNQKHVVFQSEEAKDIATSMPESHISLEENPDINQKVPTEKLTVTIVSDKSSKNEILPNGTDTTTPSSAPLNTESPSTQEIVKPEEASLRIEEPTSSDSSVMPSSSTNVIPKPRTTLLSESREDFEALYRNRPSSHSEWKQSTLAPLETHVPPEKRRSVKDIIESINRSQRLLHAAAHKDLPELITTRSIPPPSYSEVVDADTFRSEQHISTTDNDLSQALKALDETQRELDDLLPSTSSSTNGAARPSNLDHHNTNGTDIQKPNNEEVFKKCRVNKEVYDYRETSPTASNLDWNPVPKPKRSKNLSEHREH